MISLSTDLAAPGLGFVGVGLQRPECVLATRAGDLYCSDWRGGVARIHADGAQCLYTGLLPGAGRLGRPTRPNGIALKSNGNFLMADLGENLGGVFELSRQGVVQEVLTRVDGVDL